MNVLSDVMSHPLAHRMGWVLLHSLWQGALLGVLFGMLRLALKRSSAQIRYTAGCVALALLLATPVATFICLRPATVTIVTSPDDSTGSLVADGEQAIRRSAHLEHPAWAESPATALHGSVALLGSVAPWLTLAWMTGVLLFTVRLAQSCWWVRTVRRCENEAVAEVWMDKLDELRHRLEISRPVRLLKSALVEVPTVVGWVRPIILLPASSLTGLTPRQLEAILAHELAHVRRWDHLVNSFQCFAETIMFYHPVVWWISRLVREERENCCDDLVVKVCEDRLAYVRALARLESFRCAPGQLAIAATGGSFVQRIRRLLGLPVDPGQSSGRQFAGLALLGTGLGLVVIGVYILLIPPTYEAVTRIRIEPDFLDLSDNSPSSLVNSLASRVDHYAPYFVQTEFEIIQSRPVLERVVNSPRLADSWARHIDGGGELAVEDVVAGLRNRLRLRPIRNTTLVEIGVAGDDPAEAADVANAIAEAYHDYRLDRRKEIISGGVRVLREQLDAQGLAVKESQKRVDRLRTDLSITDSEAEQDTPVSQLTSHHVQQYASASIDLENQLSEEQTRLETLRQFSHQELRNVLSTASPHSDEMLEDLARRLGMAETELVSLRMDYGANHPQVVKVRALAEELNKQMDARVNGIMKGLEARVSSLQAQLRNLDVRIAEAKRINRERANEIRPYFEAKRELNRLTRISEMLAIRVATENIDKNLPRSGIVDILTPAKRPLRPVAPNRLLATGLAGLGAVLMLAGLVILRSGSIRKSMAGAV